jgi:hypothetical protein
MSYEKLGFVSGQTLKAEHLNHMEEGIAKAGGGADWKANEGEDGYIKNRTHWEQEVDGVIVLPEQTYTLENQDGIFGTMLSSPFSLEAGKTYKVVWNGEIYVNKSLEFDGFVFVGDGSATGIPVESSGEPFVIGYDAVGDYGMMVSIDGSAEVTMSLREVGATIHKLDVKYLPDGYPDLKVIEGLNDVSVELSEQYCRANIDVPTGQLKFGNKYRVFWDNVLYDCVCSLLYDGELFIGNPHLVAPHEYVDNGVPFFIGYDSTNKYYYIFGGNDSGGTTHKVKVVEYTTIDRNYLPADIGTITPIVFTISEDGENVTCNLPREELGKVSILDLKNRSVLYFLGEDPTGGLGIAAYNVSGGSTGSLGNHYTVSFQAMYSASNPGTGLEGTHKGEQYHVAFCPGYNPELIKGEAD